MFAQLIYLAIKHTGPVNVVVVHYGPVKMTMIID